MLEGSPDCVKLISADGRILAITENGRCAMEIDDVSTVRGVLWKSLWPAESHGEIDAAMAAALGRGSGAFKAFCPTAKGTPRWWEVIVTRIAATGEDGMCLLATSRDITAAREAERKLQASEERYRMLFESMDQGCCVLEMVFDAAGRPVDYRFIEMNAMFEKHTGLAGAAGRTARELLPGIEAFWIDTYGRVALSGESIRFEREDAALGRWFDVYATRIGAPADARVALLFSDITARKQADERLRKLAADLSEADRHRTEFLSTLAHELRNPLAPIRSGLNVMRLGGDNAAAVAKVRGIMERQVGHMVHLIDDLLDIARISGGKLELKKARTALGPVLSGAVETSLPIIEAGRHTLHVDVPEEVLMADIDAVRISQVFANLLNNAAKYTPPGGRIDLAMRRDGAGVLVTVSDNGVGIEPAALASVFDMFTQVGRDIERSQGGLGIGLALVRRLAELHGGSVGAESAGRGAGSTFSVRLPLLDAAPDMPPPAPQHGDAILQAAKGSRMLVADDNVDAALTLSMILEMHGHTVRVAHDGMAALACARDFMPELVFLDIGMPRMNGYEAARAIRLVPGLGHARLVALTGWGTDSDLERSREAGFDCHMTKPIRMSDIDQILAGLAG